MINFFKRKRDPKIPPPRNFNTLKINQRVVTFRDEGAPLRGTVRFTGDLEGSSGHVQSVVGLELDEKCGSGTGKWKGNQLFVCKEDHAYFVDTVMLEEDFDKDAERAKKEAASQKQDKQWRDLKMQERKLDKEKRTMSLTSNIQCEASAKFSEDLVKSGSTFSKFSDKGNIDQISRCNSGKFASNGRLYSDFVLKQLEIKIDRACKGTVRRSNSFNLAEVIVAAGESSSTDIREFIEKQQQLLDDFKKYPTSDEDAAMNDDERTDSASFNFNFDDKYFWNLSPLNQPITQPGFSEAVYSEYVNLGKDDNDEAWKSYSNAGENAFGSSPSSIIKGIIAPPGSLREEFCGKMRGLQGHQNSCYLDATLFSMFAYSWVFDTLLHRKRRETDLPEYDEVQSVLREAIVNPLRVEGFVRADRVLHLRELLDKLSSRAGLINKEKDPEEFLNSLLMQVLKADPFLHLKSRDLSMKDSEGAYFYQIITEKDDSVKIAQVQNILEDSFFSADIILAEVPSCLILQLPRFGSRYKMYDMILPNLELDVSYIVESVPRVCNMCGLKVAQYECKSCIQSGMFKDEDKGRASFCSECHQQIHTNPTRRDHKYRPILVPRQQIKQTEEKQSLPQKQKMELFAVVCIETSYYVAFVKCGTRPDSPWCFFESMADRREKNGYNIPAVTPCPEAMEWLSKDPKEILSAKERGEVPDKVRRLLGDGYLCMYQNLDDGVEDQKNFEVPSGFELGTVVEIPGPEGQPTFGVIRWIGHLPQIKDKIIVGLELEQKTSACSDGTFNGTRYFTCEHGRGFFCLLESCRKDSRLTSPNSDNISSGKVYLDSIASLAGPVCLRLLWCIGGALKTGYWKGNFMLEA
ncbi:ubiquitin carboxyl-terminal hydrolase CYLD-like [Acropora millepora]|uniref:ubiquitin carboxyl-terminal hydrolase CYLD-like n=1 Tax=Acropora millepora TaxID=45264 RepID=UPI001CF56686|nr:ubiquitin carboxyl-terminal hydrolase CYLD-like [Acropora millepora]